MRADPVEVALRLRERPALMPKARARKLLAWLLGAIGLAAVGLLIRRIGPWEVIGQLQTLWTVLPLTLLITAGKYPLQTAAWRLALAPGDRPPWWPSVSATLAGDAVGYLTLAGPVAGEPARALLLQKFVPISVGIAVGAFERVVYASTGAILVLAAIAIASARLNQKVSAIGIAVVAGLFVGVAVALLRRSRHRTTIEGPHSAWRAVLHDLWIRRRASMMWIVGLGVLEHALLALEAGVILSALGTAPTFSLIIVFEGLTKTLNSVGSIVPGRLGIAEGGSTLIAAGLGVGPSVGLALALARRARALVWSAAGLGVLIAYGLTPRRLSKTAVTCCDDMPSRDAISSRTIAPPPLERGSH